MPEPAKGVYLLFVSASGRARVGRLGEQQFDGSYVYVGSARGPGGMRRLQRHLVVALGLCRGGRWHIDHLLALGRTEAALFIETSKPVECLLAQRVAGVAPLALPGFGSSDCRCPGHLFRVEGDRQKVVQAAAGLGCCRWIAFPPNCEHRPQRPKAPCGGLGPGRTDTWRPWSYLVGRLWA